VHQWSVRIPHLFLILSFGASISMAQAPKKTPPAKPAATEKASAPSKGKKPMENIVITTSMGTIEAALDPNRAPITVENFMKYVDKDYYAGTVFHRVIKDFMIQGGGMTKMLKPKSTDAGIKIEADNGWSNKRGTLAMARTGDPNSATSQFFINHRDNMTNLDHTSKTTRGWGYTVFGEVTSGMDVVDKIAAVETGMGANGMRDVPKVAVEILSIKRKTPKK